MTFKFFSDENIAQGLPAGPTATFQAGVNHKRDAQAPEGNLTLPWLQTPQATWINYSCHIECILDSGMVLHKTLPQVAQPVDTLASYNLGTAGSESVTAGENLKSSGSYTDVIQRMATSDYRFLLTGFGLRAGFPVPVPALKTVAGIPATPERQWVHGNEVIANFYGIPVFYNAWELWYIVSAPPKGGQVPPPNLAEHIAADHQLPAEVGVAIAPNDYNALPSAPAGSNQNTGFTAGT